MVVITYVYAPNERTEQTIKSFQRFGYEVAIIERDTHRGNGEVMRLLYETYQRAATGHQEFVYVDAADSYCQKPFFMPTERLIFSTEKACYPHVDVAQYYPKVTTKYKKSPWKFLNGGGYGGSLKLMIEFIERYKLHELPGDANGQHELMTAYIQAFGEGFPIHLDLGCEVFQTMAFNDPSEFQVLTVPEESELFTRRKITKLLENKVTGNIPAILHFNGLTDMSILKELK